ncbi:MAG: hypothetical protein UR26_C0003G0090 [candidate division TM6 bacterium GW2011_GWF2_32_72]|nr:MAG: hypothetical protein UR26_C0003G0090 [candidate division TM6 bacterium GW2011_GWF2_32_72]
MKLLKKIFLVFIVILQGHLMCASSVEELKVHLDGLKIKLQELKNRLVEKAQGAPEEISEGKEEESETEDVKTEEEIKEEPALTEKEKEVAFLALVQKAKVATELKRVVPARKTEEQKKYELDLKAVMDEIETILQEAKAENIEESVSIEVSKPLIENANDSNKDAGELKQKIDDVWLKIVKYLKDNSDKNLNGDLGLAVKNIWHVINSDILGIQMSLYLFIGSVGANINDYNLSQDSIDSKLGDLKTKIDEIKASLKNAPVAQQKITLGGEERTIQNLNSELTTSLTELSTLVDKTKNRSKKLNKSRADDQTVDAIMKSINEWITEDEK